MMDAPSPIKRLLADLRRPGGGITVGVLTLLLALLGPVVGTLTVQWTAPLWMLGWLFVNMLWGAYGYYPRGVKP